MPIDVEGQFILAFQQLAQSALRACPNSANAIAIAYSGGLDSSVLLHLASKFASREGLTCFAFHVHHGLSVNADDWLEHCRRQAEASGAVFVASRVQIQEIGKTGVEEAARIKRYHALGELSRGHDVPVLMTAHHLDDQAETVLMQLLRGSGVAGLSGMSEKNAAPKLLGADTPLIIRPLLSLSRDQLETYALRHGVNYVEDESNFDLRYVRNAIRHQVMPVLAENFPGFAERVARSAQHSQSAQKLLSEIAATDLLECLDGEALSIPRLKNLSRERIDNLLRHWFSERGMRMPSTAWLDELYRQLFSAKEDARLCVGHPECDVHRYRDRVFISRKTPRPDSEEIQQLVSSFKWEGQQRVDFPAFGGHLSFAEAEQGVDAKWLREQTMVLRYRHGGERLKLDWNRPSRSLKHHYQALGIPEWERPRLPVVAIGSELLFAAGIGMNGRFFPAQNQAGIRIEWRFNDC